MGTWKYQARLVRTVDGDTFICDIDQGMNTWSHGQYVRMAGINAPELHGATKTKGEAAKGFLEAFLPAPPSIIYLVTVEYHEFEKYGRVLAYAYVKDPYADPSDDPMMNSANQAMLDSGNAVAYP